MSYAWGHATFGVLLEVSELKLEITVSLSNSNNSDLFFYQEGKTSEISAA